MNLETRTINAAPDVAVAGPAIREHNRARLRLRLYLALIVVDAACILVSLFAASLIYKPVYSSEQWYVFASLLVPVYLLAAFNNHAYSATIFVKPMRAALRGMQAFVLGAAIVLLLAFYLKSSAEFSRGMVTIGAIFGVALIGGFRYAIAMRASALFGGTPFTVALIADGPHNLPTNSFSFVVHADGDLDPAQDCPMMFDRLAHALRGADRVVVACPPERRVDWVRMLKGANVRSEMVAPELKSIAPLALDRCGNMPTMVFSDGPLGRFDTGMKRAFDIVVSSSALLLLAPLLLVVALLIKISDPGPVFFVQTRIGQGNRLFRMFKFRSMRAEKLDHNANMLTRRNDSRVTPIGALIRRSSIDELPQLINVLRGEMSIVGPRPHALGARAADKLYWEVDGRYWHRHAAKPGLTGLAQIRGFRGATEHASDLTNRLQADLEYLHNWSIWRDILIMLQTVRVITHHNAY